MEPTTRKQIFKAFCERKTVRGDLLPLGTSNQEAIGIIREHLLGKDWYVEGYPASRQQVNTEIVGEILLRYTPYDYRQLPFWKRILLTLKEWRETLWTQ